jgi:hypothetical protein
MTARRNHGQALPSAKTEEFAKVYSRRLAIRIQPTLRGFRAPSAQLIDFYTATNKPDEATKWREERAKYGEVAPAPPQKN